MLNRKTPARMPGADQGRDLLKRNLQKPAKEEEAADSTPPPTSLILFLMWKSPRGPRKLAGQERALFVQGVLTLYDLLRDAGDSRDDPEAGVPVFDHIPMEERPFVLLFVAETVLGDGTAPPVRAWNAGTIAAVFAHLETMVELEIDSEDVNEDAASRTPWRSLIHEVWMKRCFPGTDVQFPKGEGDKQPIHSRDLEQWSFKIHGLAGELLEDHDFEMEEFLDAAPERVSAAKDYLGIQEEYFRDAPPALTPCERRSLTAFQRRLLKEEARR